MERLINSPTSQHRRFILFTRHPVARCPAWAILSVGSGLRHCPFRASLAVCSQNVPINEVPSVSGAMVNPVQIQATGWSWTQHFVLCAYAEKETWPWDALSGWSSCTNAVSEETRSTRVWRRADQVGFWTRLKVNYPSGQDNCQFSPWQLGQPPLIGCNPASYV